LVPPSSESQLPSGVAAMAVLAKKQNAPVAIFKSLIVNSIFDSCTRDETPTKRGRTMTRSFGGYLPLNGFSYRTLNDQRNRRFAATIRRAETRSVSGV
jgi:hypothetical protein